MIIEAEFDEIDDGADELDLAEPASLPWLEADEDESRAGTVDAAQLVGFVALLAAVLFVVVGLVWYVSNRDTGPAPIADGSTIKAPEGPYKTRPQDAGGKQFAGTDDVAPMVGQGEAPEARLAGADAGEPDLNIAMPPIGGDAPALGSAGARAEAAAPVATPAPTSTPKPAAAPAVAASGVGVQLAAYSSRARAEQGWSDLSRKSKDLSGRKHRVVEGVVDNSTVYRLQVVTANRAEADALCASLKRQGLDCQVKS